MNETFISFKEVIVWIRTSGPEIEISKEALLFMKPDTPWTSK